MDKKRAKRAKSVEDGTWDCSVCTYKNSAEAFKCSMCDVRKGTSTRKPKPNPELVAQQVAQQLPPPLKRDKPPSVRRPERVEPSTETDTSQDSHRSDATDHSEHKKSRLTPSSESQRLRNIDRRSGVSMEVTVNGVTVVVTDYKPKSTAITSGSSSRSRMLTDINVGRDLASFPSVREQSNNVANSSSSSLTHSFTDDSHNDIVSD